MGAFSPSLETYRLSYVDIHWHDRQWSLVRESARRVCVWNFFFWDADDGDDDDDNLTVMEMKWNCDKTKYSSAP